MADSSTLSAVVAKFRAREAAGWRKLWNVRGRSWDTPRRPRIDKHPTEDKQAWGHGAWPEPKIRYSHDLMDLIG